MTTTEAATKLTNIMHDDIYSWHPSILEAFRMAVDALRQASYRQVTGKLDCISRAEAIDALCKVGCGSEYCSISCDDVKAIEGLPSAQPSFPQRHENDHTAEVSKMDSISRQSVIDTEGLDEQIRCEMCRNPMHTDRGCDGNCQYDEKLHERIMQILDERIKPLPSVQPEPLSDAYMKAVWTWLLDYQIKAAELKGRYTPYEVLSWVANDWRKEHE